MTVKELIEKLQGLPDDALIVHSKDSEGNRYNLLNDDIYLYPCRMYEWGEIEVFDPEDLSEDDNEVPEGLQDVVILYPR